MSASRYLSRLPARLYGRPVRHRKPLLHLAGSITCLLAIFISAGAHWAVLQSFAYTRMLVEFAEQESWGTAVKKAFDERYACSLCPKIRDGFNQEQKEPSTLGEMYQPEFLLDSNDWILFTPVAFGEVICVPSQYVDFSKAPPKPPPRAA